jgi:hypothetical protein
MVAARQLFGRHQHIGVKIKRCSHNLMLTHQTSDVKPIKTIRSQLHKTRSSSAVLPRPQINYLEHRASTAIYQHSHV